MALKVTSTAFNDSDMIPRRFAFEGSDLSPPLMWDGSPEGTASFALIMDDPDAPRGVWVHWVVYNIPSGAGGLPEDVPKRPKLADGIFQGLNDSGGTGYSGPHPPVGEHRYFFRVYALDGMIDLPPGAKRPDVEDALRGHILAEGRFMGRYRR